MNGLRFWRTREFGTALVLAAMLVASEIAQQSNTQTSFLFSSSFLRILQDASFIGIAAIGACIVIISGGVDLSSGAVMSLAAVTFAHLFQRSGMPGAVALLGAALIATLIGAGSGFLVGKIKLPPFIATLGFLSIARGISYWVTGGPVITMDWKVRPFFLFPFMAYYTPWVMLALGVLASVLLARFSWGRYVYAVGGNEEAARFSGLPVDGIKVGIYAAAGLASALAGCCLSLYRGVAYGGMSSGYELKIIAACAIGGVSFSGGQGTVAGALLGAITLEVLQNLLTLLDVPSEYIEIAYGSAIILAVAIDLVRGRSGFGKWFRRKSA